MAKGFEKAISEGVSDILRVFAAFVLILALVILLVWWIFY